MATAMTTDEARAAIEAINNTYDTAWQDLAAQINVMWDRRGHEALGYPHGVKGWATMCKEQFGERHLPKPEQQAIIKELKAKGMSTRATAAAVGTSKSDVDRQAQAQVSQNGTPDLFDDSTSTPSAPAKRSKGTDGKSYPATKPDKAPRKPSTTNLHKALVRLINEYEKVHTLALVIGDDAIHDDIEVIKCMVEADDLHTTVIAPYVKAPVTTINKAKTGD